MSEARPDPDALLRRLEASKASSRGRLKVFFGASPGVGKTYAMLEAARAAQKEGRAVVVGWVETHGRAETAALLHGLERLAPRRFEHRGVSLEEFDLDAALARKPGLLLVDELAHTNAPGARHAKRWQDVEELRDAGIDVFTTLNVQHLESLNDLVNQVTGVPVREAVPDRVLDGADEVEFVDLPPEELLKRLAEGKVYLPDRAAQAARNFFRRGNLLALRELALRRTAEHVDADVQDYRRDHEIAPPWPVRERILVCIRPNPESDRLVRAARRMASGLKAEWIVAYVESPAQRPLSSEERLSLARTVKLAEDLGAATVTLSGESVAAALLDFARARNVSRIVVGKPLHPAWRDRLRGSLLDEIVRGSGGIEVMVIPGGEAPSAPRREGGGPAARPHRLAYLWAAGVVALTTVVCWAIHERFDKANLVMMYLLGVAFVASRYGRRHSALAAVLSVAAFDFFFVPPYLTFAVRDGEYIVTFAVMLVVSLVISTLAARVRSQAEASRGREERTRALYALSRELAAARTAAEVARAVVSHVSDLLRGPARLLRPSSRGTLEAADGGEALEPREVAVAQWTLEHGRRAGLGTDTLPGASSTYVPLRGTRSVLGVLGVRPGEALRPLAPDQLDLLESLAQQAASGLERVLLAEEAESARLNAESERLRSTLLSSVSHDLRTPLATITGAASTLLQPGEIGEEGRRELLGAIHEESDRLNRLVTNLLDMTRLEAGSLQLHRDWHSLEELLGTALHRLEGPLSGRPVAVAVPDDLPLVKVDGLLVEQLLVNLLENAVKHSPPGSALQVAARRQGQVVAVEVADEGPGLLPGDEERVFEKFYRGRGSTSKGFGLGLPIARAIVGAHGGRISAQNRDPQGAAFTFELPIEEAPPPPEEDRDGP